MRRLGVCVGAAALSLTIGAAEASAEGEECSSYDELCDEAAEEVVPAQAEKACWPVFGWFEADVVPPPACTSPVGFCTEGELSGFLKGNYTLTSEQFIAPGDPRVPFVSFFTGTSDVSSTLGSFVGVDTGAINLSAPGSIGSGRVSTLITIVENGTGGGYFPIDAGWLNIQGESDLITGTVSGTYSGVVCWDVD